MTSVQIRPDEAYVHDCNQEILREYDDVVLLRQIDVCEPGNVKADNVPVGTKATIITIIKEDNVVQLECYLDSGGFVFARERSDQLKLHKRREEKLKDA